MEISNLLGRIFYDQGDRKNKRAHGYSIQKDGELAELYLFDLPDFDMSYTCNRREESPYILYSGT